jgi:catechol 2,3-dioxygenase-like lactoylglutathione lyase family enzyme
MQIRFASAMVDDQEKALRFHVDVLGFVKKADLPMGPYRWLTVASPEGVAGVGCRQPADGPRRRGESRTLSRAGTWAAGRSEAAGGPSAGVSRSLVDGRALDQVEACGMMPGRPALALERMPEGT